MAHMVCVAVLALRVFWHNQRHYLHVMSGVKGEMLVYYVPYIIFYKLGINNKVFCSEKSIERH